MTVGSEESEATGEHRSEPAVDEAAGGGGILAPSHRTVTIGIVTLVTLVAFESMAVTTAMPAITADLDGRAMYAWGFSAFMAASMFGTVVAGNLADRFGTIRPFLGGVGLFAAGLMLAGVAADMVMFIAGRMLQGLGGGALVVATFVLAGRAYPARLRPKLMAVISAAWVVPAMVGPLVAGTVTELVGWRWVFAGLLPFAVVPVVMMLPRLRGLPESLNPEPRRGTTWYALAAAAGVALAQYAGEDPELWKLPLGAVGLAMLVIGLARLLPAGTTRAATGVPAIIAVRGLLTGAFFGAQAFIPLMLTEHRGLSLPAAGIVLTVGSLGWSTGAWWQGRSGLRMSRPMLIRVGAALITAGIAGQLAILIGAVPVWLSGGFAVLAGYGMGLSMASLAVLLLAQSPVDEQGANGAAAQLSTSFGQVVSIGAGGVLFALLHLHLTTAAVFIPIFALMVVFGAVAVTFAGRVDARPAR